MAKNYWLLGVLALLSCSSAVNDLSLRSHNGEVDLTQQIPGDWQKVCLFTPYTTGLMGQELSGIDSEAIEKMGIHNSDSFTVLALINADDSYTFYRVSRRDTAFAYTQSQCFNRSASRLKVAA